MHLPQSGLPVTSAKSESETGAGTASANDSSCKIQVSSATPAQHGPPLEAESSTTTANLQSQEPPPVPPWKGPPITGGPSHSSIPVLQEAIISTQQQAEVTSVLAGTLLPSAPLSASLPATWGSPQVTWKQGADISSAPEDSTMAQKILRMCRLGSTHGSPRRGRKLVMFTAEHADQEEGMAKCMALMREQLLGCRCGTPHGYPSMEHRRVPFDGYGLGDRNRVNMQGDTRGALLVHRRGAPLEGTELLGPSLGCLSRVVSLPPEDRGSGQGSRVSLSREIHRAASGVALGNPENIKGGGLDSWVVWGALGMGCHEAEVLGGTGEREDEVVRCSTRRPLQRTLSSDSLLECLERHQLASHVLHGQKHQNPRQSQCADKLKGRAETRRMLQKSLSSDSFWSSDSNSAAFMQEQREGCSSHGVQQLAAPDGISCQLGGVLMGPRHQPRRSMSSDSLAGYSLLHPGTFGKVIWHQRKAELQQATTSANPNVHPTLRQRRRQRLERSMSSDSSLGSFHLPQQGGLTHRHHRAGHNVLSGSEECDFVATIIQEHAENVVKHSFLSPKGKKKNKDRSYFGARMIFDQAASKFYKRAK